LSSFSTLCAVIINVRILYGGWRVDAGNVDTHAMVWIQGMKILR
jgi:hypothetical protein